MAGESAAPGAGLLRGWTPGTGGWASGMDANLRTVSVAMQLAVESRTAALPGSPTDGIMFIVPASDPTNGKKVAVRDLGAWVYLTPQVGWLAWVKDDAAFYHYANDETWTLLATGGGGGATTLDGLADVDVAAAADGQVLVKSGLFWVAGDPPAAEFPDWPVTTKTGASYTLALADAQSTLQFNRSTAQTLTVPANAVVAFPIGSEVELGQINVGTLTVAAGPGVTVQALSGTLVFPGPQSYGRLRKVAADVWSLVIWGIADGGTPGQSDYDICFPVEGKPTTGEIVGRFLTPRAFVIPAGAPLSVATAGVAATAAAAWTLKKISGGSTTTIGTVTFAATDTAGAFAVATDATFAAGDVLTLTAPSPADATLADTAITLAGIRI